MSGEAVKDVEAALQVNREEIEKIIAEVDEDGDGQISFQEFFQMMNSRPATSSIQTLAEVNARRSTFYNPGL